MLRLDSRQSVCNWLLRARVYRLSQARRRIHQDGPWRRSPSWSLQRHTAEAGKLGSVAEREHGWASCQHPAMCCHGAIGTWRILSQLYLMHQEGGMMHHDHVSSCDSRQNWNEYSIFRCVSRLLPPWTCQASASRFAREGASALKDESCRVGDHGLHLN